MVSDDVGVKVPVPINQLVLVTLLLSNMGVPDMEVEAGELPQSTASFSGKLGLAAL